MGRRWPRRRPEASGEAGFTLVELLVATAAALALMGTLVMVMTSLIRAQPEAEERAGQIQDARVVLERMVRELRQGIPVTGAAASQTQLTIDTYTRAGCGSAPATASAVLCRVTYTCSGPVGEAACTRTAGNGSPATVLTDLRTAAVFSYGATTSPGCDLSSAAAPSFVCMTLAYPSENGESVTVEDSAYLRNPTT